MLARLRSAWLLLFLVGCVSSERGPNLVEVREVGPRHLEAGERLRVSGSGFPEGRSARVVLRGELLRAGEPAIQGVEITTLAELSSPHTLDVTLSPALVDEFCGDPDARHTTFRGDVEVAFAPRTSTGTAVGGVVEGVVLDVTPEAVSPSALSALRGEGERFTRFLGAKVARSEQGLTVASVELGGRASRGGLAAGDEISSLHDMVVRDLSDFVPPPNTRTAPVLVQRGPEQLALRLDSAGFRYHSPNTLGPAALLMGLFLVPLLLMGSPLGRLLMILERRMSDRLRAGHLEERASGERRLSRSGALLSGLSQQLPSSFIAYFAWVAITSLFTFLALGKTIVAAELDLLVIGLGMGASLFVAALASGGGATRWSLKAGLLRALGGLTVSLPPVAALLTAAAGQGSLNGGHLVSGQGSAPWNWLLFDSPISLLSGALALAALVPSIAPVAPLADGRETAGARLLGVTEWSHKLVSASLLAAVFLGGSQLPGAADSLLASAAGVLVLLFKSWLVLAAVVFLRWVLGGLDVVNNQLLVLYWLVLPSGICVLLSSGWRTLVQSPMLAPIDAQFGPILFGAGMVICLYLLRRVRNASRPQGPELGIQSWL